jgi:hypothetical protein
MPLTEQDGSGENADRQAGANDDGISEEEIVRIAAKLYQLFKKDDPEAFLGRCFTLRSHPP